MFKFLIDLLVAGPVQGLWNSAMSKDRLDDPVYKKMVRELIERNKRFEDTKDDAHSQLR